MKLHHYCKLEVIVMILLISGTISVTCQTIDNDFFENVKKMEPSSPKLDSIATILLDYDIVDTNFVKTVINVAVKYRKSKRYGKGVKFIERMLTNEALIDDPLVYAKLYDNKGGMHLYAGEDSLSLEAFSEAIRGFTEAKDTLRKVWMYGNVSVLHSSRGNLQIALDSLKNLEPLIQSSPRVEKEYGWSFYGGLRFVYYRMEDKKAALKYSKKMKSITNYPSDLWIRSTLNLADDYIAIENDSAGVFIDSLFNIPDLEKVTPFYSDILGLKIDRLIEHDRDALSANNLLVNLENYCKQNICRIKEHQILNYKAKIAELKGRNRQAEKYFINAYDSYQNNNVQDPYYSNSLLLKYFENKFSNHNDFTSVALLDTLEKNYTLLREDIIEQEVEAYRIEFESNKKELENQKLLAQQELKEAQIQKQNRMLAGGLIALAAFGTFIFILLRHRARLKSLNQNLATQRDQIKLLNRELNHRVKNNLAFMTSLLEMQGRRVDNVETKQILRESENRLKALALVHSRLFKNESDTQINLKDYLTEIIQHLQNIFETPGKTLEIEAHLVDIPLEAEQAIRVGLILNELVTNSVKHAFANVDHPTITLQTSHSADGKIKLSYKDNGPNIKQEEIGHPNNTSEHNSIGLKLIHLLEKQLANDLVLSVGV